MTTVPAVRIRRVLARCRKSARAWRTLRCARATAAAALARLADPFWQRARRRWYRASLRALRPCALGVAEPVSAAADQSTQEFDAAEEICRFAEPLLAAADSRRL